MTVDYIFFNRQMRSQRTDARFLLDLFFGFADEEHDGGYDEGNAEEDRQDNVHARIDESTG